ncbi:MAG: hypothetical protein WCA89_00465, partial [Terracidiphilus sp.]
AGFFEGEGTVSIMRPTKRNHGSLCVSIVNTEKHLLEYFRSRWGGVMREMKMFGNRKRAWRWILSSRQAAVYLADIQNFAVGSRMKERIFLGLAFQGNKWHNQRWQSMEVRNDYWNMNVWFYLQFRHINQRGTCTEADSFRKRD